MEKLQADYQTKTELLACLDKAYVAQLSRFEEAQLQIEKQAQLSDAQSVKISEAMRKIENLESNLHRKELSIKHLCSANENLHIDCGKKLHRLEGENKDLLLALNEASSQNKQLKEMVSASDKEIIGLKKLLCDYEEKYIQLVKKAQEPEELRMTDDMILKLEEENRNVKQQLKLKQEQFNHLEEAHENLQNRFQLNKKVWEMEKSVLLEESASLQASLDSQMRISEDLQTRLEMSNRALVHDEGRIKFLEVKVAEVESGFENVFTQSLGDKSKSENLNGEWDEEIAMSRNLVSKKEALSTENEEMDQCLKESPEAEMRIPGDLLLKSPHKKIRTLELEHANCSTNLEARESEWSFQKEQSKWELNNSRCEVERTRQQMQEVQMEVETLHSSIEMLKKENILAFMILQSEFLETYLNLLNSKTELGLLIKEKEDKIKLLAAQLETTYSVLTRTYLHLEGYHAEVSSFLKKMLSMDHVRLQPLDELSECQIQFDEQVLQMEKILKDDRGDLIEIMPESKEEVLQLQALQEAKKFETEAVSQSENEQKYIESPLKKIETEKGFLSQDKMRQYTEKEDVLAHVEEMYDRINEFCYEDVKLAKHLEKIFESAKECRPESDLNLRSRDNLGNYAQNYTDDSFCSSTKKLEAAVDKRCPLKELNHR